MNIAKYFTQEVIDSIKDAIKDAGGNEVFVTGDINENGVVTSCKVGARGTSNTVPVNVSFSRAASVLIHNHPSGVLLPSEADLSVASKCSEEAQGFYIINNTVTDVYVVLEPVKPKKIVKLNPEKAASFIQNGGALSKISPAFEERQVQIELLKQIAVAFNNNQIGAFEAGTGVGKSFAYLIPGFLWALENKERIVISTGTINLQQQLCEKDIPFVEKITGKKINYILLKGRQNYICKRRLNELATVKDLFDEEMADFDKIFEWAKETESGSKSDLSFMPSDNLWSRVNSESDACMGLRCPYHAECFVMKVRKAASSASLIVVNHHLLFADIESRMNGAGYEDSVVLPPYKKIIFDEAHGIESAATSFFSESFSKFKITRILNQMYRKRKNSVSGLLCTLGVLSENEDRLQNAYDLITKIKNALLNIEISAFDLLQHDYTKRIYDQNARDFGPLIVNISELTQVLSEFCGIVRDVIDGINEDDKDVPSFWETKILLRRLDDSVILLKDFCAWDEKRENVFWIQKKRLSFDLVKENTNPEYIVLNSTPLDISKMMNSGVYEMMDSVVCTSATLKTGRDFNYWFNRTGISFVEKERVMKNEFPSPFPFEQNMLFAVPNDAPFPDKMEFQQYLEMALPRLIQAAHGRTLVLFTSYELLRVCHKSTVLSLKGFVGRIMKQGEEDNSKLLDIFKREKESVLFATDSFWQGVDIPGESLSQVVIVKLPFSVPNDPVFVARSEAIEKRGGNSFMELSVPEAVIKFRQGVGRLIRKSDDKGVVVVLDRRIYEKRYGTIFLSSIQKCKKLYEPLDSILKKINNFIFE